MKKHDNDNIIFLDQWTKRKLSCASKESHENSNSDQVLIDMMKFLQETDNLVNMEDEQYLSGMLIW